MTTLREGLERLEAALAAAADPIAGRLAPPLEAGRLDGDARIPAPVPGEVRQWFSWHDGLVAEREADYELLPGAVPLSLEEAASLAGEWAGVAAQVAGASGIDAATIWDARWLPLFGNVAGDLLVVVCDPGHEASSPLYYRMAETAELAMAYDSLAGLVATAAGCWESGAYRRGEQDLVADDPEAVTRVWERLNPDAAREQGGVAPLGVVGGEEPEEDADVRRLLDGLHAADPMERLRAVVDLARLGHAAALDPGLELLRDTVPPVRWTAAQALGELGDAAAAPGLAAALADPVAEVRWNVADALGMLGRDVPAEARSALDAAAQRDEDETVRRVASESLARIGDSPGP